MKSSLVRLLIIMLPLYWGILSNLHQLHKLPGFRQYNQTIFEDIRGEKTNENR